MIWYIFSQIVHAIANVHQNKIIHRDLKCENIFLHIENNKLITKLGDFGLSKQLNETK